MKVGYVRVSTIEQNEQRQIQALVHLGVEEKHIYIDKLSGKDTKRPQLQAMLEFVREGDILIVSEYSRLARSTRDLLDLLEKLQSKGVQVISDKENFDTSTPQGKLMLTFFAGMAEFERAIMLQRQREGIAIAKAAGKYKGRIKATKPKDIDELLEQYRTRKLTMTALAKKAGVSRATAYRWLKEI